MQDEIKKPEVSATEEEVKQSVLKPEIEEATMAKPENNGTDEAVHADTLDTADNEGPKESTAARVIDETVVSRIRHLVDMAVASYFYMSNPKRIATLEAALAIPISDDRSFVQFFYHSENDLEKAANKAARKVKAVPEEVTIAQIIEEAQRRYVAKHGNRAIVNEEYEA